MKLFNYFHNKNKSNQISTISEFELFHNSDKDNDNTIQSTVCKQKCSDEKFIRRVFSIAVLKSVKGEYPEVLQFALSFFAKIHMENLDSIQSIDQFFYHLIQIAASTIDISELLTTKIIEWINIHCHNEAEIQNNIDEIKQYIETQLTPYIIELASHNLTSKYLSI